MQKHHCNHPGILISMAILIFAISGCAQYQALQPAKTSLAVVAPTQADPPIATNSPSVSPTVESLSQITLEKREFFFSIDGQQRFLYSRNPAGYLTNQYKTQLILSKTGGTTFVRLHLDSFGMGYSSNGQIDEDWAEKWETVFDEAADQGIFILPVFSVWYDWNDANPTDCTACSYTQWLANPLNKVNGGPAETAKELITPDSVAQQLWLNWVKSLVDRWQFRSNIIGWEIFSEVNLIPGSTEANAVDFIDKAALLIRNADSMKRPITASLADFGDWSNFYNNGELDFLNIHLYPVSGELDTYILSKVRSMLASYHKPVIIGESGLSFEVPDSVPETLTTAEHADIGIRHAIWAAMVSGAMNGRSLWWEDGVAIFFPSLNMPFIQKYGALELPASNFVQGIDFAGFQPLDSQTTSGILGGVIGSENLVLGWYRDAACEPPNWELQPMVSGQRVTITVLGTASNWQVDFYDTETGTDLIESLTVSRSGDQVTVTLPDFVDDIAFKMYPD
jgi:hypothetical protein